MCAKRRVKQTAEPVSDPNAENLMDSDAEQQAVYTSGHKERAVLLGPLAFSDRQLKARIQSLKLNSRDYLVGIDAGALLWMKLGKHPDLAVGDWDSLETVLKGESKKKKLLKDLKHLTLPKDKDRSDLFYSVAAALQTGVREVVCLGVTGGRPDHHLAMLLDLMAIAGGEVGPLESVSAIGEDGQYVFLTEGSPAWEAKLPIKTQVSVFALLGPAHGVDLEGFEFSLKEGAIQPSSQGLSNVVAAKQVKVRLRKGRLLIMILPAAGRKR